MFDKIVAFDMGAAHSGPRYEVRVFNIATGVWVIIGLRKTRRAAIRMVDRVADRIEAAS